MTRPKAKLTFYSTLLCSLLGTSPVLAAQHLVFCYDPYPPYAMLENEETPTGTKVRLLQTVVDRIDGVTAEVVLLPWRRCLTEAQEGRLDGILPLFYSVERETYLTYSIATHTQISTFWFNSTTFPKGVNWDGDLVELAHYTLGMVRGSIIDPEMEAAFAAHNQISRASNAESLMRMLRFGRVDLIAIDQSVGRYNVLRNGWEDHIKMIEHPISEQKSYFALSNASGAADLLPEFNKAIVELHEAGTIEQIFEQILPLN